MFTAPDGTQWRHGVRWFYDGAYHKKPKPNKSKRYVAYYHVFALVSDPLTQRVYRMRASDQIRVTLPELAYRFANSHETERDDFDGRAHFVP